MQLSELTSCGQWGLAACIISPLLETPKPYRVAVLPESPAPILASRPIHSQLSPTPSNRHYPRAKMVLALQCSARPTAMQPRAVRAPSSSSAFVGKRLPRTHLRASSQCGSRRVVRMGLFGLGLPELAVIAGVAALIFGGWAGQALGGAGRSACTALRLCWCVRRRAGRGGAPCLLHSLT